MYASTTRLFVSLVLSLGIIAICPFSPAQDPEVAPLDPFVRQEIIRELALMPQLDAEARKFWLERFERAPKLSVAIDNIAVHSDGIVSRYRITSKHTSDIRLVHFGRWIGFGRLMDDRGLEWGIPPITGCIQFRSPKHEDTYFIRPGESVRVQHVNMLKSQKLVRIAPAANELEKPKKLSYNLRVWETLYSPEFKSMESAVVTGRGSTNVQWLDEPVPAKLRSEVITELKS